MFLNYYIKAETIGRYGNTFYALDGNYLPNLLSDVLCFSILLAD